MTSASVMIDVAFSGRVGRCKLTCNSSTSCVLQPQLSNFVDSTPTNMAADPFAADAVDDILNYSDNDPFEDDPFSASRDKSAASPQGTKRKFDDDKENGLGLDEEVKIAKKRKPIVKLDENRYFGSAHLHYISPLTRPDCCLHQEYQSYDLSPARLLSPGSCA